MVYAGSSAAAELSASQLRQLKLQRQSWRQHAPEPAASIHSCTFTRGLANVAARSRRAAATAKCQAFFYVSCGQERAWATKLWALNSVRAGFPTPPERVGSSPDATIECFSVQYTPLDYGKFLQACNDMQLLHHEHTRHHELLLDA